MQLFDATDFEVPTEISNVLIDIAGYLIHKLQKSEGVIAINACHHTDATRY